MFRSFLKLVLEKAVKSAQELSLPNASRSTSHVITVRRSKFASFSSISSAVLLRSPNKFLRSRSHFGKPKLVNNFATIRLSSSSASSKKLDSSKMNKSKKSKGSTPSPSAGSMHQTKIGQFFTKGATTAAAPRSSPRKAKEEVETPVKKVEEEVVEDVDEEPKLQKTGNGKALSEEPAKLKKTGNGKASSEEPAKSKSGRKRRSKSTSEEEEDVKVSKPKPSKKEKPEAKKQRRRIVVEDSSSEEEGANSMAVDDDDEVSEPEKTKSRSSKKDTSKNRDSSPKAKKSPEIKKEVSKKRERDSPEPKKSPETKKQNGSSATKRSPTPEKKSKKAKESSDREDESEEETEKKAKKSVKPATKESRPSIPAPKGWNPDYNPGKSKYHPIDDASWTRDQRVPYLALAKTLESIEATSSRLKNIEILANYFRSVIVLSPNDLLMSVYLCLNKLAPAYEGVELGVAETNVMKAIAQATGRAMDKVKADAAAAGDLGIVAESSRSTQKTLFQPQPLTVHAVFQKLKEVAAMTGSASHAKKIGMITSLLVACKYSEARYLTRSLLGKLRIGLAEQSLLQAVAQACFLTPPDQDRSEWPPKYLDRGKNRAADVVKAKCEEEAYKIKSAFCECPNYDILVKALLEGGIDSLSEECKLTPGIPPRPMLAQPTKGVADVLERFDGINFTCEYKYDGERAQLHLLEDGSIRIYSRNQENNTSKYPDIISRFSKCIKGDVKACILDTEAVAWDIEKEQILPFQVLSTRKRKDADEAEIKVQVCVFAFDLIYLNGKSLIKEPLIKRRELLREHFQAVKGEFVFANSVDTNSMDEVQEFLEESVKGNCEGLMVKTLDEKATYELAKRSQKWLKLKKDYLDSGGDSLDLVVIGGYHGKGKRTGAYGGFLLACYDPDQEVYQTICKLGTGFSDEQLQQHAEALKPHVIANAKQYYRYNDNMKPDQWFDAVQVWEVKCADLSISPIHTAAEGLVDSQKGISLRFPRFLRIRDDKNIEDATSSGQVADMYKNQDVVKNSTDKKKAFDDEDDFY